MIIYRTAEHTADKKNKENDRRMMMINNVDELKKEL